MNEWQEPAILRFGRSGHYIDAASNYQTSRHPQRHSDDEAGRRRLEKLSIVRTDLYVPDRNHVGCAGRPHSDWRAR